MGEPNPSPFLIYIVSSFLISVAMVENKILPSKYPGLLEILKVRLEYS